MPIPRLSFRRVVSGALLLPFLLSPAYAADDYGVISVLETDFDVSNPTVTELNKRKLLFMSGASGIYSSGETKRGWTSPQPAFSKPGFVVKDPTIVRHPKTNSYYMFYTMHAPAPIKKKQVDKRTGKQTTLVEQPQNGIGVAYGTVCTNSQDGTGLCWKDISKDKPLIGGDAKSKGGFSPSAIINGARVLLYYRTNPPESQLVRSVVDLRDWKIENTKPVTFQSFDPLRKNWRLSSKYAQTAISDVDVKFYGKSYLMVGNDGSSHAISRWKSDNGLNFYYDPYDGGSAIIGGGKNVVADPYVEPVSKNQFRVYYVFGDSKNECSQKRLSYGSRILCNRAIQVRLMSEEKNPKVVDNYYFDEDYKAPDYSSVKPASDLYSEYTQNKASVKAKRPSLDLDKKIYTPRTSPPTSTKPGFFDRLLGR